MSAAGGEDEHASRDLGEQSVRDAMTDYIRLK